LPPELITHIFESLPFHPYNTRAASLAQFCLVNHHFLEIARPLLYHDVHLDFFQDYNSSWSSLRQLFRTLLDFDHCSILVNIIRISMDTATHLEVTAVAYLLSQLKALKSIQMEGIEDGDDEDCIRAIHKHQVGLKHLELRGVMFEGSNHWSMLRALEGLETLVGGFDAPEDDEPASHLVNLPCKLRHFVSHSTLTLATFDCVLHSSWSSLTSLAFVIDPECADLDLQRLKNLNTLRIVLEDDTNLSLEPLPFSSDPSRRLPNLRMLQILKFALKIRMIIISIQSLPIETLSITVKEDYISKAISPYLFLAPLPSSLRHFGTVFEFLDPEGVNSRELVKTIHDGRLPHLEQITIFPSDGDSAAYRRPLDAATQRRFSELERRLGITVIPHRPSPDTVTSWYTLEPHVEETDEEEDDEEGSEEDYDSEELDEFRSDYEEDEDEDEGEEEDDE